MTHNLIINYGLYKKLEINVSLFVCLSMDPLSKQPPHYRDQILPLLKKWQNFTRMII